jgi:phospholipid/cholesterol/gamma-HCH transport system substrate-binding protein
MAEMSQAKKVGLTVLLSLAGLGLLIVFLGRIHINAPGYELTINFNYVDSLKSDAPVLYGGGVRIGTVEGMDMVDGKVQVKAHILNRYKIAKDSRVTIHTAGILGEKYVQVDAGNLALGTVEPDAVLAGIDPGSLDRTLQRIEVLTDFLEPLLADPKFKRGFGDTMENLNRITADLGNLIESNSGDISASVKNLKSLSEGLKSKVDDMKGIIDSAKGMLNDKNRKNVEQSLDLLQATLTKLDKAMTEIDSKKGPIGLAVYDDEVAQNLRDILRDLKTHPWKLLWKK